METIDRKLEIIRMRLMNVIDEHAEILAQAQGLHKDLTEANERIKELEEELSNVQKDKK